jgi:hypothetical protein
MNCGNQPILVAGDIENGYGLSALHDNQIGMRKVNANLCKGLPLRSTRNAIPAMERFSGVQMAVAKFFQDRPLDHSHIPYIMYGNAKEVKFAISEFGTT